MDELPEIPENLGDLSPEDLATLRADLTETVLGLAQPEDGNVTEESLEVIRSGKAVIDEIDALTASREAVNDELDGIVTSLSVVDTEPAAELEDESDVTDVTDEDTEDEQVEEAVTASVPRRRATAADLHEEAPETPSPSRAPTAQRFVAASGVSGVSAGEEFATTLDLGQALVARWKDIAGGGSEKIAVANLRGNFTPEQTLVKGDLEGNMRKLGGPDATSPAALTAAVSCAPNEPIYDVGCYSSTARPLQNSLANMRAPRGGYSVYPSPTLADITDAAGSGDGTGVWTSTEEADAEATKNACAVISCSNVTDHEIYGVYRCLTVSNLQNMTFPELVDAYLNKLAALWARLAEITMVDAMIASPNNLAVTNAADAGIGTNLSVIDTLIQAAEVYRYNERYETQQMDAWINHWVIAALQKDYAYMAKENADLTDHVVAKSAIEQALAQVGIDVTWLYDTPTGWGTVGAQAAGALNELPTSVEIIFAPKGNFRALDQGTLQVGVTNRGQPWDLTDMASNQFTMFWESFEGVIDMGCPSWTITLSGLDHLGGQYCCTSRA